MDLRKSIESWLSTRSSGLAKQAQAAGPEEDADPPMPAGRLLIDGKATRTAILDAVKESVAKRFPIENDNYRIELKDVRYEGPTHYTLEQQKQALLHNRKLGCSLAGTWRLIDRKTGKVIEERRDAVMRVPYYTNRGTIINNGSEYTVISQARLSPGVYTRRKQNGDLESQFNVANGKGFRLELDKATGRIGMRMGQANLPLYPVLKAFGMEDKEIAKAWGSDVALANAQKNDPKALQKLYERISGYKYDPMMTPQNQAAYIRDELSRFGLDPNTVARTLGIENVTGVTPEVLLRASQKLLNVNRGIEEPDNRDNPRFSKFYGIEHMLGERIDKDAAKLLKPMLFKVGRDKSLARIGRNALGPYIDDFLSTSGLAQPGEEANPMSILVQQSRITRTGEGGISSPDLITPEARGVQGDYLGFVDFIAGPESSAAGVDVRGSYGTVLGKDNKLYNIFRNLRTGKKEYLSLDQAADKVIAFPDQDPKAKYLYCMRNGVPGRVKSSDVDYMVPSFSRTLGAGINMNPMPTAIFGMRSFYSSKFWEQYLPQKNGEVPLVDSLMPDGKTTFNEYYGRKAGCVTSPFSGTVTSVTKDGITVAGKDGRTETFDLVTNLPHNRMTEFTLFPLVSKGQEIKEGDLLAHSNFTDPKTGAFNMGQNLKVAILPGARNANSFEDACWISASAAKRLSTNRLYNFDQDTKNGVKLGKNKYLAAFPSVFTKQQAETLDDDGVVKVGTELHRGDPIIVATGPKILSAENAQLGKLSSVLKNAITDKSQTWNHDWPGVVTDVVAGPNGAKVLIKSEPPVKVGDKLCYDEKTEVLTSSGWKLMRDVTLDDFVATLNPETHAFEYLSPELIRKYEHKGRMYRIKNSCLDLQVTENHMMFVQRRDHSEFEFLPAKDIFGKRVSYKKDAEWLGTEVDTFTFPTYQVKHRWGLLTRPEKTIPMDTYLMLLGMYLSEGNVRDNAEHRAYSIEITQVKKNGVEAARKALDASGIHYVYNAHTHKFSICGRHFAYHFRQFGHSYEKYIPEFVFGLSRRQQTILFNWLMWGDGHCKNGMPKVYVTSSPRLADDFQRLCLHVGKAGRVVCRELRGMSHGLLDGRTITTKHEQYAVQIINHKLTPTVNHGHVHHQDVQEEGWIDYDGFVYCCTMPKWHAIYVRRNGHACWCGNSPRGALKGVTGTVLDDDKMPRDAVTNEPYDMLVNPMGFLSRIAPGQMMEIALGKVAKKTGRQIRIPQLPPPEGWLNWTKQQLAENGVSETADVFDPQTGRTIKGVGDGYMYVQAMHHLAEKKYSARGLEGGYTQDQQPAKGGETGAKKISGFDTLALLSHGATEVLKDAMTVRGTQNQDYWRALRLGLPLPEPGVPFIYQKFLNNLRAGGINVVEKGDTTSIMPQTDEAIDRLAEGRVIESSQMVDSDFDPVKGGLFDLGKTGGMGGTRWSMILLPEPVPNPVMEEPIRRLLGLTSKGLEDVLSGKSDLNGKTGGTAVREALANVNVEQAMQQAHSDTRTKRGAVRDNAVKTLGYLQAAREMKVSPADWMISRVPVLPPAFRPISKAGNVALVPDTNELYKELLETKHNYEILKEDLPASALTAERLNVYKAVKAAFGLGNSVTAEGQAKNLKGPIRQIIGTVPKCYDDETEILTENRRWIRIADLRVDDTVATVNPDTKALEWQVPSRVIHMPYCGKMVRTCSKKIDILVTPDHDHFVEIRRRDKTFMKARKIEAAELIYSKNRMRMLTAPSCGQKGTDPRTSFGGLSFADPEALVRFLGMYLAEGWIPRKDETSSQVSICQSTKSDHVAYIDGFCQKLGIPVSRAEYVNEKGTRFSHFKPIRCVWWTITDRTFAQWVLHNFGAGSSEKFLSDEILAWDARFLRILIEAYLRGDGERNTYVAPKSRACCATYKNRDPLVDYGSRSSTASKLLADDMANLCMRIGLGFRLTDVNEHGGHDAWNTTYRFRIDGWNKVIIGDSNVRTEWADYAGQVHCCTAENGLLVLRRNGRTFISGNCGQFQSKVVAKNQDLVGRSVTVPDKNLGMDQVGIPEDMAWTMYKPFVTRGLVQRGYSPIDAIKMIDDRTPTARHTLDDVMKEKPVLMDRAPTWHKFNIMAFKPFIVEGKEIRVCPMIDSGYNMDHDGDFSNSPYITTFISDEIIENRSLTSESDLCYNPPIIKPLIGGRSMKKESVVINGQNTPGVVVNLRWDEFPHYDNPTVNRHPNANFYLVPEGVCVRAYDEQKQKLVWAPVKYWSRHGVNEKLEVVTVELSSGRQILTDDDPRGVYGIDPETFTFGRWRPSEAIGKFVPRCIKDSCQNETITVVETEYTNRERPIYDMPLDRLSGWFMGAMVGDGWNTREHDVSTGICFCFDKKYNDLGDAYRKAVCHALFSDSEPHMHENVQLKANDDARYGDAMKISINSSAAGRFIDTTIGHGAENKHLPPFWQNAPKEFKLGLFEGLLDTDGTLAIVKAKAKKNSQLMCNYSTVSMTLAAEVQYLCRTLGVDSKLTAQKTPAGGHCWQLSISTKNLKSLGLDLKSPHKAKALAEAEIQPDSSAGGRKYMIPVPKNELKRVSSLLLALDKAAYVTLNRTGKLGYAPTTIADKIARILKATPELQTDTWKRWLELYENLDSVVWERVEGFTNTGMFEEGYDLTVPGYETFMNAEGVILSNTVNIHVPASDKASKEALEKMLPSKNLFSLTDMESVRYKPEKEQVSGLWALTSAPTKKAPRVFESKSEAIKAYRNGEIGPNDPVEIRR